MPKSKSKKRKLNSQHRPYETAQNKSRDGYDLTHEEIWDDSALIRSWNDALAEYEFYHSIHARGEDVDEVLRRYEEEATAAAAAEGGGGRGEVDDGKDGEVGDGSEEGEVEDVEGGTEIDADYDGPDVPVVTATTTTMEIDPSDSDRSPRVPGLSSTSAVHAHQATTTKKTTSQHPISYPSTSTSINPSGNHTHNHTIPPLSPPNSSSIGPVPTAQDTNIPRHHANTNTDASTQNVQNIPPGSEDNASTALENLKMAYYWAGYYSGLYDGQQKRQRQEQPQNQNQNER